MQFNIISVNVRGMANPKKRRIIYNYVRERANIAVLQETHSKKEHEEIWRNEWGGSIIFDHGDTNSRGVCVLIAKNCSCQAKNVERSGDGRFIICDIMENDVCVTVCNIYAPNKDNPVKSVFRGTKYNQTGK